MGAMDYSCTDFSGWCSNAGLQGGRGQDLLHMHGSVTQYHMDQPPGLDTGAVWQVAEQSVDSEGLTNAKGRQCTTDVAGTCCCLLP